MGVGPTPGIPNRTDPQSNWMFSSSCENVGDKYSIWSVRRREAGLVDMEMDPTKYVPPFHLRIRTPSFKTLCSVQSIIWLSKSRKPTILTIKRRFDIQKFIWEIQSLVLSGKPTILTEVTPQIHFDVLLPSSARPFKWLYSKKAFSGYSPFIVPLILATWPAYWILHIPTCNTTILSIYITKCVTV